MVLEYGRFRLLTESYLINTEASQEILGLADIDSFCLQKLNPLNGLNNC